MTSRARSTSGTSRSNILPGQVPIQKHSFLTFEQVPAVNIDHRHLKHV